MHLSIILLEWKTLPIDGQITAFLQRSETVCTNFEVLCLRKVISDQRFCAETQGKYLLYPSSTWHLSLRRQNPSTFQRGITEKKKKGSGKQREGEFQHANAKEAKKDKN